MMTEFQDFIKEKNRELYNLILEDLSYGHLELFRLIEQYASKSKWISVNDRLPENCSNDFSDEVLAINSFGTCHVLRYDHRYKNWTNEPYGANITHWQPLPEKPMI